MKLLLALIAMAVPLFSQAASFCSTYKAPQVYLESRKKIDQKIETFAGKKAIAEKADALLSKLISAKSPVLTSWMNKRGLADKSEEEIVKAWRRYFAENFVLSKYPGDDKALDFEVEKLVDDILSESLTPEFVSRVEKLFEKAKTNALAALQLLPIEGREIIMTRVRGMKLYWPKTLKTARNNSVPLELIDWGIAYDPVPNEINIGVNALSYPNDETYVAVFAHEIGHSFDSCRWGAFFSGAWPFARVGECLRSEKSVRAKKRDDSRLESLVSAGRVPKEMAMALKANLTCNKLVYPPPGIQADQLPEAFADWFSAEVMARAQDINIEHMREDLCEDRQLVEGSSYPSNSDRLELIYLAHPQIQAKTKKTTPRAQATYCRL